MKKVMVAGCFDLLHPGHLRFLKAAKEQGDYLVVLLARDCNINRIKNREAFFSESERKEMLEGLEAVDEVVLGNEDYDNKYSMIKKIKPDVIVLGYDQEKMKGELEDFVKENEIKAEVVQFNESFEPGRFKSTFVRKEHE